MNKNETKTKTKLFSNRKLSQPTLQNRNFRKDKIIFEGQEGSPLGIYNKKIAKPDYAFDNWDNKRFSNIIFDFLKHQINMKILNAKKYNLITDLKIGEQLITDQNIKKVQCIPLNKNSFRKEQELFKMKLNSLPKLKNFETCCLGKKYNIEFSKTNRNNI